MRDKIAEAMELAAKIREVLGADDIRSREDFACRITALEQVLSGLIVGELTSVMPPDFSEARAPTAVIEMAMEGASLASIHICGMVLEELQACIDAKMATKQ